MQIPSSLSALFDPRSVAIIGASEDRDRLSGRPLRYLIEAGFAGDIYPVNPGRSTVQGLKAYRSIGDLPTAPDLALVVLPVGLVTQAVADCAARGIKAIYLLTGGFAESGEAGERLQREIGEYARAHGMRVLGPNCLGAFNAQSRFFGTFSTSLERGMPDAGPVAIASQSGAFGQHLAYLLKRRGVGLSYFISTGNELDVELGECIEWLAAQPSVGVILAYAEGVRNGARLAAGLEAARLARKPVVFVKVGVSQAGAHAAASHTAALAGTDNIYAGLFRQFGVYRAHSIEEQLDIGYACARARPLSRGRLGMLSVSGGGGVQMADAAEQHGLETPASSDALATRLRAIVPTGGHANPVDVTGQVVNEPQLLGDAVSAVAGSGDYDCLAVFLGTVPLTGARDAPLREAITAATVGFRAQDTAVVVAMVADEQAVHEYEKQGFLVYEDPARAIRALGALHAFARAFAVERAPLRPLVAPELSPGTALSEIEAKGLLRSAGIPSLPEVLAATPGDAMAAAARVAGPVALKIVSPAILHKTEIGGVVLNVEGQDAVQAAFAGIMERARKAHPQVVPDGVLVTPMAQAGVEVILGAVSDPVFGPVVMFGLGGVLAECYRDTAFRLAPIDRAEAGRMIGDTRAAQLLRGWRNAAPSDLPALEEALCGLSRMAAGLGRNLDSIDVNPLLVLGDGQGVVALDAVVLTKT